jgi:hypothetical protein
MLLYTYSMIINKLNEDCDLINELNITPDELLGYINEAIEAAETAIHTLGVEDNYFLCTDFLNLQANVPVYPFPADIYANKIRKMFYQNPMTSISTTGTWTAPATALTLPTGLSIRQGMSIFGTGIPTTTKIASYNSATGATVISRATTVSGAGAALTLASILPVYGALQYEVRKMRNVMETQFSYVGDDYRYIVINNQQEAGGNQIQLYPMPVTTGPNIMLFYIRGIRRMTNSTTDPNNVCEIPECINFLFQYVKWKVSKKTKILEMIATEAADTKTEYENMQATLREMIPDENNKVQLDLSAYYNQELDLNY